MTADPKSPECLAFERTAHAVLDRVLPPDALDSPHAVDCPGCRRHAAAVRVLLAGLPEPRPFGSEKCIRAEGFADRVVKAALRERRLRAYRRAGVGLAVAAGLVAAVFVTRPGPNEVAEKRPVPPVRVGNQLSEASAALAALTRRTADETLAPTRDLIAPVEAPTFPVSVVVVPPDSEPTVESLASLPQSIEAGVEPVTNTARRAVHLFLRDTGLASVAMH